MKNKKIISAVILSLLLMSPYDVFAEQFVISNNGSGTDNVIEVTSVQNTEINQENNADISNTVNADADTGNNQASSNSSGDTTIITGDSSINASVENEDINQNQVSTSCCVDDLSLNIENNGVGSDNSINHTSTNNTVINVNNNANISNNVDGTANTGQNSANNNLGNVNITTGNIYASELIKNSNINIYDVKGSSSNGGSAYVSINENGAYSDNSVWLNNANNLNINIQSSASIVNDSNWDLNTGRNKTNKNNGDVEISTGDILFESIIENTDVNVGLVNIDCCGQGGPSTDPPTNPPDGTPPPTPTTPTNPTSSSSSNGSSSGGSGSTGGSVLGDMLPATGSNFMLLFLFGNIMMLFLGGYLRLRSGRSPNYLFAR